MVKTTICIDFMIVARRKKKSLRRGKLKEE
jgi:hypothetical protein